MKHEEICERDLPETPNQERYQKKSRGKVRTPAVDCPPASHDDGLVYVKKTINASDWEAAQTKEAEHPAHHVVVTGLPKSLLSDGMLDAMLQQSGFYDAVRNFKVSCGNDLGCSQVSIALENYYAAEWCHRHFHGRHWGGAYVTAELAIPEPPPPEEWHWPSELSDLLHHDMAESSLAADSLCSTTDVAPTVQSTATSGRCWLEEATLALQKERIEKCWETREASSNGSTRDGSSETEDQVSF
jgi:hypothetical protein